VRIDLQQEIRADRAAVWPWLTDPRRMNRWSSARIEAVSAGEGGRMDGVAALRRVVTPGRAGARLLEVVRISDAPARFVYCVFAGAPALRSHEGEITLTATRSGTLVRWRVAMEFAVPGLGVAARVSIEPELRRSMRALAGLASEMTPEPTPRAVRVAPVDLLPLRAEADRVLAIQRAIADRLERANDRKQWFARVYQYVTEEQLAHLDRGEVDHPEWVLRLIPRFHDAYAGALAGFEHEGAIDPAWQRAWSTAEHASGPRAIVKGLLLGVAAHIETDLPLALAETWREHFRGRCEYVRFRADYLRMGHVFRRASDRLMARMPSSYVPAWLRVARKIVPSEIGGEIMRRYYDVPRKRLAAFESGAEIAARA
jgi:hypothetical protein